jgi:hypothetical protein
MRLSSARAHAQRGKLGPIDKASTHRGNERPVDEKQTHARKEERNGSKDVQQGRLLLKHCSNLKKN